MALPRARGESIHYEEGEEHFLRRLGGAVIVHWDSIPADLQDLLIEQAADMADSHMMVQGSFQIGQFIKAHKGGDLRAKRP
jgi:hypothetical protein